MYVLCETRKGHTFFIHIHIYVYVCVVIVCVRGTTSKFTQRAQKETMSATTAAMSVATPRSETKAKLDNATAEKKRKRIIVRGSHVD